MKAKTVKAKILEVIEETWKPGYVGYFNSSRWEDDHPAGAWAADHGDWRVRLDAKDDDRYRDSYYSDHATREVHVKIEYSVSGTRYESETVVKTTKKRLRKVFLKYNPDNPSEILEASAEAFLEGTSFLLLLGMVISTFLVSIFSIWLSFSFSISEFLCSMIPVIWMAAMVVIFMWSGLL